MYGGRRYKRAPSLIAKRQKARRHTAIFLKAILPIFILIGFVFLARAEFLKIRNFEVSGFETLPEEDIKNTAKKFASGTELLLLPKSNILLLDKDKLAAALLSSFTRLEAVQVNKQFFERGIKLEVVERKSDFLWCFPQNECFFMNKEGLVFEKAEYVPSGKLVFRGVLKEDPLLKSFASSKDMNNFLKLVQVLKDAGLEISSINLEYSDRVVAESNIGKIIFNSEEADLSLTAQNIILLVNEVKSKTPGAYFEYIDARFGNKIFYKL
ncbi:FtsQ-type POTRA domain-containing protein [Patescibacteria group bacterium]|nr:FtsQ-type POTRA domain-containing protein [Patescibacteria group bacterium]